MKSFYDRKTGNTLHTNNKNMIAQLEKDNARFLSVKAGETYKGEKAEAKAKAEAEKK